MKTIHYILTLFVLCFAVSCTDNDEPLTLNKLKLKYDVESTQVPVNKTVSFTLSGDNYIDYTDEMTLVIDGESVDGNSYTFSQSGTYEVQASVNGKYSNTIGFSVSQGLKVDRKSLLKDQMATFTLYDVVSGDDITNEGTYFVNDEPVGGHTFSSSTPGEYVFYAQYVDSDGEDQTTDKDTLHVVAPTQRALIEDYTGTWCGYCPRLQGVISELTSMTDNAVTIALHSSSSDVDPDPYEYENIDQLIEEYNTYHQFPLGQINRTIPWTDGDPETPLQYMGGESPMGIAATTKVNGTQLTVDVRIASTQGLSNNKIVVAVLENNLYHEQTNYLNSDPDSDWYQAGNPIPEYENDHVMRHAMTNIFGDEIPSTNALEDFTETYTMNLEDYLENPEDGEVAVFVLDDGGTVLQVKRIGLNTTKEFE